MYEDCSAQLLQCHKAIVLICLKPISQALPHCSLTEPWAGPMWVLMRGPGAGGAPLDNEGLRSSSRPCLSFGPPRAFSIGQGRGQERVMEMVSSTSQSLPLSFG